jgi:hypothetical protein
MTLQFHQVTVILIIFFSDNSIFNAKAAFRKTILNVDVMDSHATAIPRMASTTFYFLISVAGTFISISCNKKHTRRFR